MRLHVHKLNTETSDITLVKKDIPTLVPFDIEQFLAECDNTTTSSGSKFTRWLRYDLPYVHYDIWYGLKNLAIFASAVWKWRWWDFSSQLEMMDKQLEVCEKHWGKHTHYVGDTFTLGRIVVVRSYYKKHKEADTWEEESRYLSKFIKGYARLVVRLWD